MIMMKIMMMTITIHYISILTMYSYEYNLYFKPVLNKYCHVHELCNVNGLHGMT